MNCGISSRLWNCNRAYGSLEVCAQEAIKLEALKAKMKIPVARIATS